MENTLKRLLDAELRAQELVDRAFQERDRLVEQAQSEARTAEKRLEARIPEIQGSFARKADERAQQSTAELERRQQERRAELESMALERMSDAVNAAFDVVIASDRD